LSADGDGFDIRSLAITHRAGMRRQARPDATIHRHSHRWGQLVYTHAGVMRVETDNEAWVVPPTRAIWLPARLPHVIGSNGELALRTLYIAADRAKPLPAQPAVLEITPLLRELILYVLTIGMLAPDRPEHDRVAGFLVDLLVNARRIDLALPLPRDPRALQLAQHLIAQPDESRELYALASLAGASLRTLQRLFPRETGLTIDAWRQKCRMVDALARLSAGASVTQAALDCGYQSLAAFIGAFSRQFGVTPGRFARSAAR
jgi:AraC-like DNA-binding protein